MSRTRETARKRRSRNDSFTTTYLDGLTDLLVDDSLLDSLEVLIKSTLETNHDLYSGFRTGIDSFNSFRKISCNRLLAEDVLSVGGSGLDLIGMEGRRGANPNSIDLRIGDNIHSFTSKLGDIVLGSG